MTCVGAAAQADERASVLVRQSRVEDCYMGLSVYDYAQGALRDVVLQRNGCALVLAECARVSAQECLFRAQRLGMSAL